MFKPISDPGKNPNTAETEITIAVSNTAIKILNSAIRSFEKYDRDDVKYVKNLEALKAELHTVWTILNPS